MDKKTRNIVIAVVAVVVLVLAIWLIAGGGKKTEPAATEAPAAMEAVTGEKADETKEDVKEEVTEAPAEETKEAPAEEKTEASATAGTATEEKIDEAKADVKEAPAEEPTEAPTEEPTEAPTEEPTEAPTEEPTEAPTEEPTEAPTEKPTEASTEEPTEAPTEEPTEAPTEEPTEAPTEEPTEAPTEEPTEAPTEEPTEAPTEEPTEAPTEEPTEEPTEAPTEEPTEAPTEEPTETPASVKSEETGADVKASIAETPEEEKTEEKPEAVPVAVPQLKPMTLKGKVTLNTQTMALFANMLAQGNEARLAKVNNLIEFVNGLEFRAMYDGVDAEAFITLKDEDLASFLVLKDTDKIMLMSDVVPSYSVTVTKDDLAMAGQMVKMPESLDPQKLAQAVLNPVMRMMTGIRFGETEAVEETIQDTVFTSKTPIDMTTKEMALLGLNAAKEIMDNPDFASILEQAKARGINIPVEKLDQLIEKINSAKDEDLPVLQAAAYANEKQDMIFRAEFMKDGKEMMHALAGKVGSNGVSEFQMDDQMFTSVKVGNEGVFVNIKVQGFAFGINVVPEARENGKAVVLSMTLSGMELLQAEIEKTDDAVLTGAFDTSNKTDITLKDMKENREELAKAVAGDIATNYKPVLIEKLRKVAPDMIGILSRLKNLVKQLPAMIPATTVPAT